MRTLTLRFEREKETTNTVRFKERRAGGGEKLAIGQLYLTKDVAADVAALEVTVVDVTARDGAKEQR